MEAKESLSWCSERFRTSSGSPPLLSEEGLHMNCDAHAQESNARVAAIDAVTAVLRVAAIEGGIALSGDGRVSEEGAAMLLGYSQGHLKRMRQEGNGPVCFHIGMNGSRLSYRLGDLAAFIESMREDVRRGLRR